MLTQLAFGLLGRRVMSINRHRPAVHKTDSISRQAWCVSKFVTAEGSAVRHRLEYLEQGQETRQPETVLWFPLPGMETQKQEYYCLFKHKGLEKQDRRRLVVCGI